MNFKIKAIGLAVLAVIVLSASMASAASAAPKFTSSVSTSSLLGGQVTTNVFTTSNGQIKCATASYEGTVTGTAGGGLGFEFASITVHPTFGSCTAFGLSASIDSVGCNFVLTAVGTLTIECESGKSMTVTVPAGACTITIGAQGPLSSVSYTNGGSGSTADVVVTFNISGLTYTSSGGACGPSGLTYTSSGGACGPSGTNGTLKGTMTLRAYTTPAHTSQRAIAWDAS